MQATITEAAQFVFEQLGPGHTESVYQNALKLELELSYDMEVVAELPVNVLFRPSSSCANPVNSLWDQRIVGQAYVDLMVRSRTTGESTILELKSIQSIGSNEVAQLAKYVRLLSSVSSAMIVNFPKAGCDNKIKILRLV